jgi:hypothetical protein
VKRRVRLVGSMLLGLSAVALGLAVSAASAPKPITRAEFSSGLLQLQAMAEDASFSGGAGQVSKLTFTCPPGTPAGAVDISCDDEFNPDNEIAVAVNPVDPDHVVAGSNDYWLAPKGATLVARVPSGFFVSNDGGATWLDGQVPMGSGGGGGNGDPVVAFNRKFGAVHMLQLNAGCGQAGPFCGHISIGVSTSADGGTSWGSPVVVAQGSGSSTPSASGIFNDKPWMTVDNDPDSDWYGRAYVTYTKFELAKGAYVRSPIMVSWSDDGGKRWTPPREISGSDADLCTYQEFGPAGECDEDQFSVPVVLSDGTVVVHFANGQNEADWETDEQFESQILVVRSDDGGATWSDPVKVAALEDGSRDYPLNVDERATQTGYQFRTQTVQGMTVDPETDDLYAFWADNRDGTNDVDSPVTNSQVYYAKSTDGGLTARTAGCRGWLPTTASSASSTWRKVPTMRPTGRPTPCSSAHRRTAARRGVGRCS